MAFIKICLLSFLNWKSSATPNLFPGVSKSKKRRDEFDMVQGEKGRVDW